MSFLRLCTCTRTEESADYITPKDDVSSRNGERIKKTASLLTGNGTKSAKTDTKVSQSSGQLQVLAYKEPLYFTIKFDSIIEKYQNLKLQASSTDLCGKDSSNSNSIIKVFEAIYQPTGLSIRLKLVNLDACDIEFSVILHELLSHRQLRHENIDSLLHSFVNRTVLWGVYPSTPFGSCSSIMRDKFPSGLPQTAMALILRDTLQALEYLHDRSIIHRSVSGHNLLISPGGIVKLSGLRHALSMLSSSRHLKTVHDFPGQHFLDSLLWASPELLQQNLAGYDTRSDVYSVGITACELANGFVPFSDVPLTKMLIDKVQGVKPCLLDITTVPELADGGCDHMNTSKFSSTDVVSKSALTKCAGAEHSSRDDIKLMTNSCTSPTSTYHRTFSPQFHEFVDLCLMCEPSERPTSSAQLHHSFIRQTCRGVTPHGLLGILSLVYTPPHPSQPEGLSSNLDDLIDDVSTLQLGEEIVWDF